MTLRDRDPEADPGLAIRDAVPGPDDDRAQRHDQGAAVTTPRVRKKKKPLGSVALVGAGPGDPGLLTVRGRDLLARAEVVIAEVPAHRQLAESCRPGVEVVDGGFGEDGAPLAHAQRVKLVLGAARSGKRVVRLFVGDPFTYATGPEEAAACVKAGIAFEIVPGVSSASAVPAYAGIPLTGKNVREVRIVNVAGGRVDWTAYGDTTTLVLLSAVESIADVAARLIAAGRAPETPVAMTSHGTTTEQLTVVSTLAEIADDAAAADIEPPAVTVVGSVVSHREKLSWFETKPLFGWRVLVPRTKDQAGPMLAALGSHGAVAYEVPTIAVEPPRTPQQMEKAIRGLVEGRYEWVAFTSVNALRAVREKFEEYGLDARAFSGLKVAVVGDATETALRAWGIVPDLVPADDQSAHGLVDEWPPFDDVLDPINRVFLPRADIATDTLVAGLVELGWEVDDVTAYRTVRAAPPPVETRTEIKAGAFDAVLFTSSSTVRNLVGIAGKPHPSTVIGVIGPQTAKTAEEHGLRVDVMAARPGALDLVEALAELGLARQIAAAGAGEPVSRPSEHRPAARRRAT